MLRAVLALAAVAAVATTTACGGGGGASHSILDVGHDGAYAKIGAIPNGQPYVMSIGQVCVAAGDPVPIDSVTATNATGHMTVFDWGVRRLGPTDHPTDYANHVGYLHKVMPGFNHKPITVSCSHPHGAIVELDVNVRKSTDLAVARNFVVHYHGQQATVPFGLVICTGHCTKVKVPAP